MYRMRSTEALLDKYEELEKQEIFLADPKSLNDPMEGFLEFFWSGDRVLWKNFLRHYLVCLEHIMMISRLKTENQRLSIDDIPILKSPDDFPTEQYRTSFVEMSELFLTDPEIQKLLKHLELRRSPVLRNELLFYLRMVHFRALHEILKKHRDLGFGADEIPPEFASLDLDKILGPIIENIDAFEKDAKTSHLLFEAFSMTNSQMFLIHAYNDHDKPRDQFKRFVLFDFPEAFVERVRELSYPNAYVACFFEDCSNAALWGYYANEHKGVCLKFKDQVVDGRMALRLNLAIGLSGNGPIPRKVDFRYEKVEYSNTFQNVDFFRSLGRLPLAKIDRFWFADIDGTQSTVSGTLGASLEDWRKAYWETHLQSLTQKLCDWGHEKEYRIMLTDALTSYSEPAKRKLKYDFEELEGIVFGYRTTIEDKVRIMKVVEKKCVELGRKEFQFFQASYSSLDGNMRIDKLNLLKYDV